MKIGFFTPHINNWPPHYETELELIQNHLDKKDEVVQFICNAELSACDNNPYHDILQCLNCMGCRDFGASLLQGNFKRKSILNLTDENRKAIADIRSRKVTDIKHLQEIHIDNFDLGYAVGSSLISHVRDPEPDLGKHSAVVNAFLISALGVYWSMINWLEQEKFDIVYTFNGRLAHVKAVLRACQKKGVDCFIHERGHNKSYYSLYKNTTPHDITYVEALIKKHWEDADPVYRSQKGSEFYTNRAQGKEQHWFSFVNEQAKGLLPENWDASKKNIVIFNSSEDEFASVGKEWANPIYQTQSSGIEKIIKDLAGDTSIHVYLRIHPNLKAVKNKDKERLYSLSGPNFTLIPAESPVSTYDLIEAASTIVSFGSTVGMEAVYWRKPSVLAGKSHYHNLGGLHKATSHTHLLELLRADLQAGSIEPALMYGFYLSTFGLPYHLYKAETLYTGKYRGVTVVDAKRIKYPVLNWLMWKPFIRGQRNSISVAHRNFLIKQKYT